MHLDAYKNPYYAQTYIRTYIHKWTHTVWMPTRAHSTRKRCPFLHTYIYIHTHMHAHTQSGCLQELMSRANGVPFYEYASWIRAQLRDHITAATVESTETNPDDFGDCGDLDAVLTSLSEAERNALSNVLTKENVSNAKVDNKSAGDSGLFSRKSGRSWLFGARDRCVGVPVYT